MAARIHKRHSEAIRDKIQATSIVNRLQKHIDGKVDMSSSQVTAAMGLLDRTVPKLSQIQLLGDENNPLVIKKIETEIIDS